MPYNKMSVYFISTFSWLFSLCYQTCLAFFFLQCTNLVIINALNIFILFLPLVSYIGNINSGAWINDDFIITFIECFLYVIKYVDIFVYMQILIRFVSAVFTYVLKRGTNSNFSLLRKNQKVKYYKTFFVSKLLDMYSALLFT